MAKEQKDKKEGKTRAELHIPVNITSTATPAMSGGAGEYTPEKLSELRRNAMVYSSVKQEPAGAAGMLFSKFRV